MEKTDDVQSHTPQALIFSKIISTASPDGDLLKRDIMAKAADPVQRRIRTAEARVWTGYLRGSR